MNIKRNIIYYILPIIIIVTSALNLIDLKNQNIISILNSFIGFISIILFLLNKKYDLLFLIWIIIQIPIIFQSSMLVENNIEQLTYYPILSAYQIIKFSLGFTINIKNNMNLHVYVNLIPLIYLLLYKIMKKIN
jgi:hypothetical protein